MLVILNIVIFQYGKLSACIPVQIRWLFINLKIATHLGDYEHRCQTPLKIMHSHFAVYFVRLTDVYGIKLFCIIVFHIYVKVDDRSTIIFIVQGKQTCNDALLLSRLVSD